MRLIDADKLAKTLRTNALSYANSDEKYSLVKSEALNEIAEIIDCEEATPTVYDVDEVIEKIKADVKEKCACRFSCDGCLIKGNCGIIEAITIVKGGCQGE